MANEIELKLALSAAGVNQLRQHPLLATVASTTQRLINTYVDTPTRALEQARIALRLRSNGTDYWQTVKTAGSGHGGLHARREWEWSLDNCQLDLEGLRQLPIDLFHDDALLTTLAPTYCTDFERIAWLLDDNGTQLELALDQGEIVVAGKHCPIRELEIELKEGDENALWRLAATLADSVALRPANASKAARAIALRDDAWPLSHAAAEATTPQQAMEEAIDALDAYTDTGNSAFLARARHAFTALTHHPDDRIARLATALDQALADSDWLTPAFGRDSLALLSHLMADQH